MRNFFWSEEKRQILIDHYIENKISLAECAKLVKRSKKTVHDAAVRFGIIEQNSLNFDFTEEEQTQLCLHCPFIECVNCLAKLDKYKVKKVVQKKKK